MHQSNVDKNVLLIEMEFANGGSLLNLVEHYLKIQKMIPFKDMWLIFIRLLKGIDCLYFFSFSLPMQDCKFWKKFPHTIGMLESTFFFSF